MTFSKKMVEESLLQVELFAEGNSESGGSDSSTNTGACKNDTEVNVGGCA